MVGKIVKLQGKVPFKTEAKGRLKTVVAGLLEGIVSQETLNSSVSAKAMKRTVRAVIPARYGTGETLVSKETYYSVKSDLLQCQKRSSFDTVVGLF